MANVMFRYGSGGIHGVLNDFDHPIRPDVSRSPSSHLELTGTAPYMPIDILRLGVSAPPVHLYRHDLESLYYVLVRTVCPTNHPSIRAWFRLEA
ncbi:hypothetical protein BDP27DRAFT_1322104 [Rhodocollybia butyracea]|uniref:Fungal-type protein kinase domain-containing protein n=1 Tax=Rhodocollybia butyracea TaxID=206335 RepID=A0A9P5UAT7_9AGAR|nr:hypothetical protein BDP27DRAFT_1322104 [Rhodocollybia butyracea]